MTAIRNDFAGKIGAVSEEGRKYQRTSHNEDTEGPQAEEKEDRLKAPSARLTGSLIRKVSGQFARGSATGRPASSAGKGEEAPEGRPSRG